MATDKAMETVIEALKQALVDPAPQRLFRSGKLTGLFSSRNGVNGEAAAQTLRDGLLEVVRTETKSKTNIDWVKITPRGVEFLHQHESPLRVLEELKATLEVTRQGVPAWIAEMQQQLQTLANRLAEDSQHLLQRLDALGQRLDTALRRLAETGLQLPDGSSAIPWAQDALNYLEKRRAGTVVTDCPLPELFAALARQYPALSITAFHDGLRRLQDLHLVRLLPFHGTAGDMTHPEYALLDGATLMYFANSHNP